jgi:hypothetical protein
MEAKQRAQRSVRWVTKIYYLELLCALKASLKLEWVLTEMQPGPTALRAFRSPEELEIINFLSPILRLAIETGA